MNLRLHAFVPRSRANGPGVRAVVWVQGCTLGCPGCFNPATHSRDGGEEVEAAALAARLTALGGAIEGVTFSGGEPLEQAEGLLEALETIRTTPLGAVLFTGFTIREVERMPLGSAILARVDAVIAGRYVRALHVGRGLLGSSNQEIRLLTERYRMEDFARVPPREAILRRDGDVVVTGITPVK